MQSAKPLTFRIATMPIRTFPVTGGLYEGEFAMHNRFDAITIGGGHNGLTCGAYLGKAGLKVDP
ncbi:hypothetical protein X734_32410 [Mesorhizobium sp. L2C084A000]|nr:hypothetical protein X734_32410 [Mesorhizobium sp. L2C084A000]